MGKRTKESSVYKMMTNLVQLGQFPELRVHGVGHGHSIGVGRPMFVITRPVNGSIGAKKFSPFTTIGEHLTATEVDNLRRKLKLRPIDGMPDERFWKYHDND